ncbi:hypothetical protein GE061_019588 [Apolygus lucorum]|uniref:Uncharacterized protein n=1 Tax=Apolygus lucorum TaxID=248454 RepID=A0A6A4JN10_APOLU|nr:hypothetical protein GE061_019588 [Apolygus lucorum]
MKNFWVTVFSLVATVLVVSRAHLSAEKRCQSICQLTQLDEQCKMCNARSPVRFGKRSKELYVSQHPSSVDFRRLQSLGWVARLFLNRVRRDYMAPDK